MEDARVQVISRETIKPSSETPPHLKNYKLSLLDQLVPPIYVPLIFFYQANELKGLKTSNHDQISQQLKKSLSNTLTFFYPFAGRAVEDSFTVDCCDAGVEYVEARVHARLTDIIQQEPNMEELKQYIPMDPSRQVDGLVNERTLLFVQLTFFDCGGIVVGVCNCHKLADCASIAAFMHAWAASCSRGEHDYATHKYFSQKPSFDLASYFPPRDDIAANSDYWGFSITNEKFITKRFVFNKEKLAALKELAASSGSRTRSSHVKDPTRVELVSAFVWKNFIEVARASNRLPGEAKKNIFGAFHAVNLRARMGGKADNVFGNGVVLTLAFSKSQAEDNDQVEEFHELVSKLRSAIRRIDEDYIARENSYLNDILHVYSPPISSGEMRFCPFSSWCRFHLYEVDYGWGKPIWFCASPLPFKNTVILVETRCGEGIEAWVNMEKDYLEMLETKIKLI